MVTRVLFLFIPLPMFWALFDQQVQYSVYSSACQPRWHLCPSGVTPKHPGDTAGHTPTECPGPSSITAGQPFRVLPGVWHRRVRGENVPCLLTGVTGKGRNRWEIRPPALLSSLSPCFLAPQNILKASQLSVFSSGIEVDFASHKNEC